MSASTISDENSAEIWRWLEDVADPEIPVLSVVDLGIVRDVHIDPTGVTVTVTPTYSGCPATEVIEESISSHLRSKGLSKVTVKRTLSPAWSSTWISESGRKKLRSYGIAPPLSDHCEGGTHRNSTLTCPRCGSDQVTLVSQFGSTACKASYKCVTCLEPFEYFKCI